MKELETKLLNKQRMEKVLGMHKRSQHLPSFRDVSFHCECNDQTCHETISMSTEMYARLHKKAMQFIVVLSHHSPENEEVGARLPTCLMVEKLHPTN